jgi:hypothetical protein
VGGVAAAEELVSLVDSGDNGVMVWMANTAEATALWLAETAEGKDSVGIASWVAETASALHPGQRRQRRRRVVGGGNDVGVALWVVEMTLASHCGRRKQRWRRIVGGGNKVSVTLWVAETTPTDWFPSCVVQYSTVLLGKLFWVVSNLYF